MCCTRFPPVFLAALVPLLGCSSDLTVPDQSAGASSSSYDGVSPKQNLEVILRPSGAGGGFGLVKFRQPKDGVAIVHLDVWVRDLTPNAVYRLQRATDMNVNDDCAGANWLILGQGPTPGSIITDDRGTGRAAFFRDLSAFAPGTAFDIHFRVIDAGNTVVLESVCYQFAITP